MDLTTRDELENALRERGSSLERKRQVFIEEQIALAWVHEKAVAKDGGGDATSSEKRKARIREYLAHLHESTPVTTIYDE